MTGAFDLNGKVVVQFAGGRLWPAVPGPSSATRWEPRHEWQQNYSVREVEE